MRDIDQPDSSAVIVKAILGLGKSLRVRVTAEGVETREQLEWLRAEGCDQIQGYLISPPVPADKAMDQYEYWNSHSPWAGAGGPVIDVTVNT